MTLRLYSTDTDSGTISVIDATSTKVLREIPVGNAPRGSVKFTSTGRGYVSNCGGNTISEIDAFTDREIARIEVGAAPRGIGLIDDQYALVSNSGSNTVSVVDLSQRRELFQIPVGRDPRHMAVTPDGRAAYVAVWGSHYIAKLDTSALAQGDEDCMRRATREVLRIPVGRGAHPYSVGMTPKGDKLIVANTQADYLTLIDTAHDRVTARIGLKSKGARAVAVSPDARLAYATIEDTSEVAVVELATAKVLSYLEAAPGPRGVALSPDGTTLYASGFARLEKRAGALTTPNTISVVDISDTSKVVSGGLGACLEVDVGAGPCSVAIFELPDGAA